MRSIIRQYAIALTNLFASAGFTVITPFYPAVADRVGIPSFLIGIIFSAFPIASIVVSLFLPKIMLKIGRNSTLIIGLILIASSNLLVSFLESFDTNPAIFLSFLSRILSGAGAACEAVASNSILSSDYPSEYPRLVAYIEVFGGLGIIIGPLVGSLLFSMGGFRMSCQMIGLAVLIYVFLLMGIIGRSREYVIDESEKISMRSMIAKPKICLNFFMGFMIMMAVGVCMPTLEMHLISYGLEEENIGYWYMIYTAAYLASSMMMTREWRFSKKGTMMVGNFLFAFSFLLLGPCPFLIDRNLVVVGIGHHIMGWACSIQYIPLIPYLIEISHSEYLIHNDDRLNDVISGIVNISICCGEIIGPIMGSLIPDILGSSLKYRLTYFIVSLMFFGYGAGYLLVDRILVNKIKKDPLIIEEEMAPL